jgi:alpha-tubulin suppressor-like RCC1 family protein
LRGCRVEQNSERGEPTEIEVFNSIRIKQIFAKGFSSFAISEGGNNLYGWGNNKNGQLGLKPDDKNTDKVPTPTLIDIREKFSNELFILQERMGEETHLCVCTKIIT